MVELLGRKGRLPAHRKPFFTVALLASFGFAGFSLLGSCRIVSRPPDLAAQIAAARTPADHAAIAQTLMAEASNYTATAAYHRRVAAKYRSLAGPGADVAYRIYDDPYFRMAEHCQRIADDLEHAASDLTALAREHERVAASLQEKGKRTPE